MKEKTISRNKNKSSVRRTIAGILLFAAAFCLLFLAANVDGMAQWYAVHIYPLIVGSVGRVFGWFPFSVTEIGLYLLIFFILFFFLRLIVGLIRKMWTK